MTLISSTVSSRRRCSASATPFGRVGVEKQQAVDVVDELELLGRAQHAVRLHAAQLGGADSLAVRQLGADAGERRFDAGRHIRRAAHDLMLTGAVIDEANGQAIRVRVAVDAQHLGDDDALDRSP